MMQMAALITAVTSWLKKHNPVVMLRQQALAAYNPDDGKVTLLPDNTEYCAYSEKPIQPGDEVITDRAGRKYLLNEISKPIKAK